MQVQADANGNFTFTVQRPSFYDPGETGGMGNTTAVIEALEISGAKDGIGNVTYTFVPHAATPTLDVTNTSGNEDTAIALGSHIMAALNDTDSSETLTITITGVPAGATLNQYQTNNGGGNYTLSAADLSGLTITPTLNYSGSFTLAVKATSTESGPPSSTADSAAKTLAVTVVAVADAPNLATPAASGNEDAAIPLSISASLNDTDGSETLGPITISGVPTGATLNHGTNNGGGNWTLTPAQLSGLTVTPPANSEADFTLTVTAKATESSNGNMATTTSNLAVTVNGVADAPNLTVTSPALGNVNTSIPLAISSSLVDTDGSETLSIQISGVPAGATLNQGTNNGGGNWTLTQAQLAGLAVTPAANDDSDFTLTVTAVSTESNTDSAPAVATASTSGSLFVIVNGNRYDFNSGSTAYPPTQTEYTGVTGSTFYSANPLGYGWQGNTTVSTFDRGTLTGAQADVRRDGAYGTGVAGARTFSVNTGNGTFLVNVTVGDTVSLHDQIQVSADGGASETLSTTAAGRWTHGGFTVTVADGVLDLVFTDQGGSNSDWVVNAVEIRPNTAAGTLSGPAASLAADGTTIDTFSGTGATPNAYLTVTSTLGTIMSADALGNATVGNYDGVQVQADANGNFTVLIKRPLAYDPPEGALSQSSTLHALEIDGRHEYTDSRTYTAISHVDGANLSVANATGNEDTAIGLSINSHLVDTDGSETLSILVSGVPSGATLNHGVNNGGGNWTLTQADLGNLTITPAANSDVDFTLGVTATFTDNTAAPSDTQVLSGNLTVTVNAVADTPNLSVTTPASGSQGSSIPLSISSSLNDTDGSETLSIIISGVPATATLNHGTNNGNGTWTLTQADLGNLTITPSPSSGDFNLGVVARATETGPAAVPTATTASQSILVHINSAVQFHFDFNASGSPTQTGYTAIGNNTVFGGNNSFGWVSAAGIAAATRTSGLPTPTPAGTSAELDMLRDFQYNATSNDSTGSNAEANARTFRVSGLAPSATYYVTVAVGDSAFARPDVQITTTGGGNVTVSTAANEWKHVTVPAVSDGSGNLDIKFKKPTASGTWVVNGIDVRSSQNAITFDAAPAGPFTSDPAQTDTFTGHGATANSYVTVATTMGTVIGDAHSWYSGVEGSVTSRTQVLADANGTFTFAIQRPGSVGAATITAEEVTGASLGTTTRTYNQVNAVRRFDFDGAGNVTAGNFTSVHSNNIYNATLGYGWDGTAGVAEFDRGNATTALRRDGHYGSPSTAHTFSIAVNTGTQYNVRIYSGDQSFNHTTAYNIEGTGNQSFTTTAGNFNIQTTVATSGDGIMTIVFSGSSWVVNGIDIWETLAGDPGVQPQLAAPLSTATTSVATLSDAALQPIVHEAITRWAAAGISQAQVATLSSVPVLITDLGPTRELGVDHLGYIEIDDDAQGNGWFVDPTPADDREFAAFVAAAERRATPNSPAAGKMDLLTVVMHELGHELGLDDLTSDAAAHDIMAQSLATGVRRVPTSADSAVVNGSPSAPAVGGIGPAHDGVFASLAGDSSVPGPTASAASSTRSASVVGPLASHYSQGAAPLGKHSSRPSATARTKHVDALFANWKELEE